MKGFRIEFNGQCLGPYSPAVAWQVMEDIFAEGIDVTLVNMETGSHVVASHPKEG
jgi:hypothetical protein